MAGLTEDRSRAMGSPSP